MDRQLTIRAQILLLCSEVRMHCSQLSLSNTHISRLKPFKLKNVYPTPNHRNLRQFHHQG
jgi:hypothetical protein